MVVLEEIYIQLTKAKSHCRFFLLMIQMIVVKNLNPVWHWSVWLEPLVLWEQLGWQTDSWTVLCERKSQTSHRNRQTDWLKKKQFSLCLVERKLNCAGSARFAKIRDEDFLGGNGGALSLGALEDVGDKTASLEKNMVLSVELVAPTSIKSDILLEQNERILFSRQTNMSTRTGSDPCNMLALETSMILL